MYLKSCAVFVTISLFFCGLMADNFDSDTITTRVLDLNNPEDETLLRLFNLTTEQLRSTRRTPSRSQGQRPGSESDEQRYEIKDLRIQDIRNKIEYAVNGNPMIDNSLPTHEMAAYPQCLQVNETTWSQDNNVTISFAESLFESARPHMYLDTAVLRLYKKVPQGTAATTPNPGNCDDSPVENQIRVTISTIQHFRKNKREKRKRICNTVMLNSGHTGWVEIDVKNAIHIWEKAENQHYGNANANNNNRLSVMVGWLAIEVHDEEERPLKAGLFFEPPKCSEAYPAIPWNFYRQHFARPAANMEKVPRLPRLDIKFIDYRSVPSSPYRNLHRNHKFSSISHRPSASINNNSGAFRHTTISDLISSPSSSETHIHRKRHESNHRFHRHHHHSGRSQDSNYETISSDNTEN